ncbi:MAG TPA: metallophosphoesterase family protein [Firmicutes bacterium]|nr:metallophosphoesterase family protein [Bacillota bacterium]
MRIGVFGDVHGNLAALNAVLADGRRQQVEHWVCLGDVAFKGPQPAECIEAIAAIPGIAQIQGNTDQWLTRGFPASFQPPEPRRRQMDAFRAWGLNRLNSAQLRRLQQLPLQYAWHGLGEQLLCVHASPHSTEDWYPASADETELSPMVAEQKATIVVYGHIHSQFARKIGERMLINTGSAGNPIDGDSRAAYLILTIEPDACSYTLHRVAYDIAATVQAAREGGFPYADEYEQALRTGAAL